MRAAHTQRGASQRHAPAPPRRCCSSTGGRRRPMPSGPDASSCGRFSGNLPKSLRAHRPWPCRLPWTPAGKGSKGWVRRATEAALPNPGEGSERPVRDNKRGDQWPVMALWTKQSGAQVPPRRGPPLSPDFPRPPVSPGLAQEGGAQAGQEPSARCLAPGQMGTSASLHARMDGGGSSEQAGKTIDTGKVRRCR
jgi:hypothetical protein